MQQTLFYIPHADPWIGLPLFGYGWLMIGWTLFSIGLLAWLIRKQGWNADTKSYLPVLAVVWLAIAVLMPFLMDEQGVPIRGYGVMLLLGVVAGVALAAYQARRMGQDPEMIFSLAFYTFILGIVGARIFYVVQKWDQFRPSGESQSLSEWGNMVGRILDVTKGGLVVYGSLIGGLIAAWWFVRRRNLPMFALADLIAPSMLLGLALGRIGCLLNGCCFGGICDASWAITFPAGSPPYQQQQQDLQLQGITLGQTEAGLPTVAAVDPHGPAADAGLVPGQPILRINGQPALSLESAKSTLAQSRDKVTVWQAGGSPITWKLPVRSLPVHPTQIYSAINAALLALLLWAWYPFRRTDGEVIALLLTLYPITRFLLEIIRTDEQGLWGTGLTISQQVSIGLLMLAAALWFYLYKQPNQRVWPETVKRAPA